MRERQTSWDTKNCSRDESQIIQNALWLPQRDETPIV